MATVTHFTPNLPNHLICQKGAQHEGQALNIVCLDPLCRDDPLACSICFSQTHKYHKVSALHKFFDDYQRNIGNSKPGMLHKKISKHHGQLKELMASFKNNFLVQIDKFTHNLDKYAAYLCGNTQIRSQIGTFLNVELDPLKIKKIKNHPQLHKSLKFILNNCLYDHQGNMINTSQILKQNQDRVCALLDKMVYMTQFCEKTIKDALSSFDFASVTLKEEKTAFSKNLSKLMNCDADPVSLQHFSREKTALVKLIDKSSDLIFEESQKACSLGLYDQIPDALPNFLFGKHRHQKIQLDKGGLNATSTVNAMKPQFALAWPNLNLQPMSVKEWSIKINSCRDYASKNTMALGIGRFSDLKLANFEGSPTNCLLVSSQGYTSLNGKVQKTDFLYREGDVLDFKYDPYYQILEISKVNGRKLTLRSLGTGDDPVYICTRFTYASDQVELL